MTDFNEVFSLFSNGTLYGVLIGFIIFSYLLLALFTWSFIKPLKYMGIPMVVVGVILLIIRAFSAGLLKILVSLIAVPALIVNLLFMPILIMGIVYVILGVVFIIIDNKYFKKKIDNQSDKKTD